TIACAQCHNHKYDPIPQQEYFGLFAILNNTQDADRRDESPILEIFTAEQHRRQEELDEQIARLKTVLTTETPELAESQHRWEQSLQQPTNWNTVRPSAVSRSGKGEITVDDESIVSVTSASDTDTYTVELALPGSVEGESAAVAAVRIETLPHASLPSGGSGFGNGNFVITGVRAELQPTVSRLPQARFVRITNKGVKQILSLAEVEVFADGKNVAGEGRAMQHSTAFDGPPELAIDGNTNGDYQQKSVTHTDTVDNPWWELDLGRSVSVERLVLWNRTDNGLHTRLQDFTVELLDAERHTVWNHNETTSPNPSVTYSPDNISDVPLAAAFADYHQPDFEPEDVLRRKTGNNDGW
ncbi:MAG: DUF1549 domain-containing protein, partial [Planctomycetaceae bacterium]|nr:DUF1549 domain-containing protein [Planctomycetaceae bacterium]